MPPSTLVLLAAPSLVCWVVLLGFLSLFFFFCCGHGPVNTRPFSYFSVVKGQVLVWSLERVQMESRVTQTKQRCQQQKKQKKGRERDERVVASSTN